MRRRLTAVLWVLVILTACLSGCKREKESSGIEEISLEETDEEDVSDGADEEPEKEEDVICVYVCGQVASPGVYELHAGARVYQAIESAGGTLDGAAPESLNLAQLAEDGQKVYVPSREEAAWKKPVRHSSRTPPPINTTAKSRVIFQPYLFTGPSPFILCRDRRSSPVALYFSTGDAPISIKIF